MRAWPAEYARAFRAAGTDTSGQVVFGALIGFIPVMVLLISLFDTFVVARDKVYRQTAADAATLSGMALEARAMNLVSLDDVAMTYLMADALADQAFLDAGPRVIVAAQAEIKIFASNPVTAAAAAAMEVRLQLFTMLYDGARDAMPWVCAFPGGEAGPTGGSLFIAAKLLDVANQGLRASPIMGQAQAIDVAKANGMDGALLWPLRPMLPIESASFGDLGDPTRWGSHFDRSDFDPVFQRGYTPIIGLDQNEGPLDWATSMPRSIMTHTFIEISWAVGHIYDLEVRKLHAEWFDEPHDDEALPRPMRLVDVRTPSDIAGFRERASQLGVVWDQPNDLLAPRLFRSVPARSYGYAQAELYNGTSWDLFTQDWRVRLVPASRLESSPAPEDAEAGGDGAPPAGFGPAMGMPQEVARWLNTH